MRFLRSYRTKSIGLALLLVALMSNSSATLAAFTDTTSTAVTLATAPFDDCYASKVKATSGLLNYWRLGEASGTSVADSFGSTTGTYANSPTLGLTGADTSRMGTNTAIAVTGNNGARFGDIHDFTGRAAFSLEFWAYRTHTESYTRLISKDDGSENGYFVDSKSGELLFTRKGGGATNYISAPSLRSNEWTHVVITYDGSNGRVFFNGVQRVSTASTASLPDRTTPFTVGNSTDVGTFGFKGRLDEVAVYNVALSSTVITDHYSGTC